MPGLTAAEQALIDVWDAHTAAEFERKDADAAIATMTEHPVLIHVPVGTGATGREPRREFYREIFIPQMPPDFALELLTRSVGQNRVIDEFIVRFTHTVSSLPRPSSRVKAASVLIHCPQARFGPSARAARMRQPGSTGSR